MAKKATSVEGARGATIQEWITATEKMVIGDRKLIELLAGRIDLIAERVDMLKEVVEQQGALLAKLIEDGTGNP